MRAKKTALKKNLTKKTFWTKSTPCTKGAIFTNAKREKNTTLQRKTRNTLPRQLPFKRAIYTPLSRAKM